MECTGCQYLEHTEHREQLGTTEKYVFMVTYTCSHPDKEGSKIVFRAMIDEEDYDERIGTAPMPISCPER